MVRFHFIKSHWPYGCISAGQLCYDQCALQNPSLLAMAECGRQKRLAACVPNDTCSPKGTTFMEYVDSLAVSVKTKKLTEAEAMRRYKEYKSGGMR